MENGWKMEIKLFDGKQYAKLSDLKHWDKNPRSITKNGLDRLKKQIQKLGQHTPFIIDEDGIVYGGNMRLEAFKSLGINDAWVFVIPNDKKHLAIEYALSSNDRVGKYEGDQLSDLIGNFPEVEWDDYAVDLKEPELVSDIMDQYREVEEDEVPEIQEGEAESKLGEVYQLGRHRLMCGDATKIEDAEKLMGGGRADMVFTDPPYNIDYDGKTKKRLKIENDKKESSEFFQFLYDSFKVMSDVSKAGAPIYICHADGERVNFNNAMTAAGWLQKQCIIWDKGSMVLGRQDYHWEHEPILYGWKEGEAHLFYGGRDKTTIWRVPRPTRSVEHPTMKPIALIAKAIKNSSKEEDIVQDLFGGSGSTLIACEQTNRTCYMLELDPHYCDVIRKRYAKFIGKENEWLEVTKPENR